MMDKRKIYKKLMVIGRATGCHQLPERSFSFRGKQFPVCARCTGVFIGEVLGIFLFKVGEISNVKKEGYIICGDNRWWKENVPEEWILGVVTEFYRGEKHISVRYPTYRLYVHLWCDLFLIRAAILRIKNKLQRIKKARTAQ